MFKIFICKYGKIIILVSKRVYLKLFLDEFGILVFFLGMYIVEGFMFFIYKEEKLIVFCSYF